MLSFPENPYATGNAVGGGPAFVGRGDVFDEVLSILRHSQNNTILLYGQRRIGKTSVLKELNARLLKEKEHICFPVFFDLQDKAQLPLETLLQELAHRINIALQRRIKPDLGPDPKTTFCEYWLPEVLNQLSSENKSLVLLFDEFDVLDAPNAGQAAKEFFPYLRNLLSYEPKTLNFVFVIGRKIDDLTQLTQSLFKAATTKRVSLLDFPDTVKLVRLSQTNNSLRWQEEAIHQVWQLTCGHPYLTQCLCYRIWETLYRSYQNGDLPTVTSEEVKSAIERTLEDSHSGLEWLWSGLPPAEQVVASALASVGTKVITESQLDDLLMKSGVQQTIPPLQNAPRWLQEWDLIEKIEKVDGGGYRFRVELLRRWIVNYKPFTDEKSKLGRILPIADKLYQHGRELYQDNHLPEAVKQLEMAIQLNPNHLEANLLLATVWLVDGQTKKAYEYLEKLYSYQPETVRPLLTNALLSLANTTDRREKQMEFYQRVLQLDANHIEANRQLAEMLLAKREFQPACQLLETFHKVQPRVARPLLIEGWLGWARSSIDKHKQIGLYERILNLDPEHPEANQKLGQLRREEADNSSLSQAEQEVLVTKSLEGKVKTLIQVLKQALQRQEGFPDLSRSKIPISNFDLLEEIMPKNGIDQPKRYQLKSDMVQQERLVGQIANNLINQKIVVNKNIVRLKEPNKLPDENPGKKHLLTGDGDAHDLRKTIAQLPPSQKRN